MSSNSSESSRVPFPQAVDSLGLAKADDIHPNSLQKVPSSTDVVDVYVIHLYHTEIPECLEEFKDHLDHIKIGHHVWDDHLKNPFRKHLAGHWTQFVPCPRCLHSLSPPIKTAEALGILDDPESNMYHLQSKMYKKLIDASQAIGRSTRTSAPANYIVVSPAVASRLEPLFQDRYVRHKKIDKTPPSTQADSEL